MRAVATAALLLVAACGGGDTGDEAEGPGAVAYDGACAALAQARAGDADAARATFDDAVHAPLHQLADQLEGEDRAAAARVLEAKSAIEGAGRTADAARLTDDLGALVDALRAGVTATGAAEPAPCPEE